jgi:hypothetical protein
VNSEFMLTGATITQSAMLEPCKNWRHALKEFALTYSCFPPTWQCEALLICEHMNDCRDSWPWFYCLDALPHSPDLAPPDFCPSRNWRNIWGDITSYHTTKSRQQWKCGSVKKMHTSTMIDSWNYLTKK